MIKFKKAVKLLVHPPYWWPFLRFGVAAGVEHHKALGRLDCRTVADVGANRGQFALVARNLFPEARIFSFEPLHRPAEVFRRIFGHDQKVLLNQAGISPVGGDVQMHLSRRDDSSSFLALGEGQTNAFPGTEEVGTERVAAGRLVEYINPSLMQHPALLKVDVQGYEKEVLDGSSDLLRQFDFVYVECSFIELYRNQSLVGEVVEYLAKRGLSLAGVYNVFCDRDGKAIQADFLFSRDNQSAKFEGG